jgi:hypothetical protein
MRTGGGPALSCWTCTVLWLSPICVLGCEGLGDREQDDRVLLRHHGTKNDNTPHHVTHHTLISTQRHTKPHHHTTPQYEQLHTTTQQPHTPSGDSVTLEASLTRLGTEMTPGHRTKGCALCLG